MSLFGFMKGKKRPFFSEIRNTSTPDVVVFRHPDEDFNIHSHLALNPSEVAMFVKTKASGASEALLMTQGGSLDTNNIPFFRNIIDSFSGGMSRFHCAVYFIRTNILTANMWGTTSQIGPLEDSRRYTFKLTANGSYDFRITDPKVFLENILGYGVKAVTTKQISDMMRPKIVQMVSMLITSFFCNPNQKPSLTALQNVLRTTPSTEVAKMLNNGYTEDFGITFTDFSINVVDRYDELAPHFIKMNESVQQKFAHNIQGDSYSLIQMMELAKTAASQPAGTEPNMLSFGLGASLAGNIGAQIATAMNTSGTTAKSEAVPATDADELRKQRKARLQELKELLEEGFITQEEFCEKRDTIINEL